MHAQSMDSPLAHHRMTSGRFMLEAWRADGNTSLTHCVVGAVREPWAQEIAGGVVLPKNRSGEGGGGREKGNQWRKMESVKQVGTLGKMEGTEDKY